MAYPTRFMAAVATSALLAWPLAAQDAEVTADTVLAVVGGEEITVGHLITMRLSLSQQNMQLPDDVLFEGLLERIIQQRAVSQSVDTLDKSTELALENERSALIASRTVTAIAESIEISPEAVSAAYDAQYAEYEPLKEFNASHILVETEEEAQALIAELEAGADFAELAKEKSTGPSGPNGGQLGWFGPGMMVAPFEDAVVAMEVDAISAPVQTQFGWHVIKLNDTRLPEAPPLEEVQQELTQELWDTELRARITALVEGASVERPDISGIDPSVIRDTALIEE